MLHERFENVLKGLSFQPRHVNFLIETSKVILVEPLKLKKERQAENLKALYDINEKIYKLEERVMDNEIEGSTYKTWFQKFKEEKAKLELALNGKNKPQLDTGDDLIQRLLLELSNLHQIYEKGNIIQKQTLIRGVFKDNLLWGDGTFRTAFIHPAFYDNVLKVNEKGLLFYKQPLQFSNLNPVSTQRRSRTGTVSHRCLRPARLPIPPAGHALFY